MQNLSRSSIAWALYDWANSAFALIIMTAIYPLFFSGYYASSMDVAHSTFWYGLAASMSGFFIAILSPIMGARCDARGNYIQHLTFFAVTGALATALLFFVPKGNWQLACILYMLGNLGFALANVFYDSLLPFVSTKKNEHFLSSLGFALGYFGSTFLLLACMWAIQKTNNDPFIIRLSFVATGSWWVLFSIPIILWVPNPNHKPQKEFRIQSLYTELKNSFGILLNYPKIQLFLAAYFFYIDGVNTVIKMASKLGADLHFETTQLILAIILVQVVGVPSSLIFGYIAQKKGIRNLILTAIIIYFGVTCYASFMTTTPIALGSIAISPLYILAFFIGVAQGGIQALSRSYFASLIPQEHSAALFGIYNMMGKAATVFGPILVGSVALITGNSQRGMLSICILFILGAFFFVLATRKQTVN